MRKEQFKLDMEILIPILLNMGYNINNINEIIAPHLWNKFKDAHHIDEMTGNFIYGHLVQTSGRTIAEKIGHAFNRAKRGE
jgi:hypothetical protein